MVMGIANTIIKKLRFVEIINETVHWDRAHWNISPGSLVKMLVLGTLTDIRIPLTHLGVPIVSKTMDGATSDIDWNREAIKYASELAASGFKDGIYVADCKLVTKELVTAMNDAESGLRFVSRCPANFGDSLERRMIAKAYEDSRWNIHGGCVWPMRKRNAAVFSP